MAIKIIIPPAVEAEIATIGDYIAEENPSAARQLMLRLLARCQSLETSPTAASRLARDTACSWKAIT
jgi:plasmid stabilization system protein ParE